MSNAHRVTRDFEDAIAKYCGSRYAVAVNSCTNALLLAVAFHLRSGAPLTAAMKMACSKTGGPWIEIPRLTYIGVAQSILNAGARVQFRDELWRGAYRLEPFPIVDAARRFHANMHRFGDFTCVSLHISKICGVDQGGVILLDDEHATRMLKRMRFDGRAEGTAPKYDTFVRGYHCYLSPSIAAQALWKLSTLDKMNDDLPNGDYGDLSTQEIFR